MKETWLSKADLSKLKHDNEYKIAIVQAQWNESITGLLLENCKSTLFELGSTEENIIHVLVPGAYEIPSAAKMLLSELDLDAVITLGCVIKGSTDHNEYINHAVAQGLTQLSILSTTPCLFGVLTTNTAQQAIERADGTVENKGRETAISALSMIKLKKDISNKNKTSIGFFHK